MNSRDLPSSAFPVLRWKACTTLGKKVFEVTFIKNFFSTIPALRRQTEGLLELGRPGLQYLFILGHSGTGWDRSAVLTHLLVTLCQPLKFWGSWCVLSGLAEIFSLNKIILKFISEKMLKDSKYNFEKTKRCHVPECLIAVIIRVWWYWMKGIQFT